MRSMQKLLSLLLAASMLVLAACSLATVAYNNAGVLITYQVDEYFDLSPTQEEWVRQRANKLIAWHRATELPQYRRVLNEAQARAEAGMTVAEVEAAYGDGRNAFMRVADRMLPDIADFLLQLDEQQIQYFEDKLTRDNEKLVREMKGGEEALLKKRLERHEQRFKDWMGELSASQRDDIRAAVGAMKPLEEFRVADRRTRQADFIALLKSKPDAASMQKQLRQMMTQPELKRAAAYREELEKQQKTLMQLIARMSTTATAEQRARVQKRLGGYANDIAALLNNA
jgi:chemotaxis methyl-accepting protein methylase